MVLSISSRSIKEDSDAFRNSLAEYHSSFVLDRFIPVFGSFTVMFK